MSFIIHSDYQYQIINTTQSCKCFTRHFAEHRSSWKKSQSFVLSATNCCVAGTRSLRCWRAIQHGMPDSDGMIEQSTTSRKKDLHPRKPENLENSETNLQGQALFLLQDTCSQAWKKLTKKCKFRDASFRNQKGRQTNNQFSLHNN